MIAFIIASLVSYQDYNYNLIAEGDSIEGNNESQRFENTFMPGYQLYQNFGLDEEGCKIVCNLYQDCQGVFFNMYDQQPSHHYCIGLSELGGLVSTTTESKSFEKGTPMNFDLIK